MPARDVMGARRAAAGVGLLVCVVAACADEADRAAKARVFSPEEPSEELQRAREKLDVGALASSPALVARVLGMDRLEATRRIGAHKAVTTVKFALRRGERTVALAEKHELATDKDGQFRAVSTNDQDTGLEVVYAGGHAYVKSRYGPFRSRRMDRAQQDAWRDRSTPALSTLASLAGGRVRLVSADAPVGGRPRHRYRLELGAETPAAKGGADTASAPSPVYGSYKVPGEDKARTGPDPDTALRLAFAAGRKVQALEGELVVDDATGVALSAKARVKAEVPAQGEGAAATLELELAFDVTPEASVQVAPPDEVAPARIGHAINDPLWFLNGGAAPARAAEEEPVGEATDDEPEAPAEPPRKAR